MLLGLPSCLQLLHVVFIIIWFVLCRLEGIERLRQVQLYVIPRQPAASPAAEILVPDGEGAVVVVVCSLQSVVVISKIARCAHWFDFALLMSWLASKPSCTSEHAFELSSSSQAQAQADVLQKPGSRFVSSWFVGFGSRLGRLGSR
jgi:hypothetical protein